MASMHSSGVVSSLVRRAFAVRRPLVGTPSSFSSICTTTSLPATAVAPGLVLGSCCSSSSSSNRSSSSRGVGQGGNGGQQHLHVPQQQRAGLSTLRRGLTGPLSARQRLPMRGLEEFTDTEIVKAGDIPIVGRSWTVPELRKKSFEDLHKLWFVLYKEKNMLLSQVVLSRRSKVPVPAGDRRQKVKRSMKAIKVVVGERQRAKRAVIRERQLAARRERREAALAQAEAAAAAAAEGQGAMDGQQPWRSSSGGE
ncbi:unnamed protein product [Scytosiphon promiscuus]